jgi:diguanylate cyclase (GGDEF)-like protein/PAS domain S-box-containing protein
MMYARRPALREYLALLNQVPETFRRSWDAIAIYDLDGTLVAGNRAALDLVGEEFARGIEGRRLNALMPLDAARRSARAFAQCVTSGKTVEGEAVCVLPDETRLPVRYKLVPARLDGTIVGVITFARDIRDLRAAESQFMKSEQQFRALFEQHPDALAIQDLEGRFVRINAALTALTGFTPEDLIGQTPDVLTGESDAQLERILTGVKNGETVEFERTVHTRDGERMDIVGRAVPLLVDGEVRGYCGITRDVTEERRRERESARATKRIGELYRIAAASSMSSDDKVNAALELARAEFDAGLAYVGRFRDGAIEFTHVAAEAELALEPGFSMPIDETLARRVVEANDVFVIEDVASAAFNAIGGGKRAPWRALIGMPLLVDGAYYGAIGVLTDAPSLRLASTDKEYARAIGALIGSAVQQAMREKRLDELAFHDALTGLPNRALLTDRLERALFAARRNRRSFAVHFVDIDHFKHINDTYGHHIGDGVLVAVAKWLQTNLRDSDTVARIGGDEFVVLQPEIDSAEHAEDVAARIVTIHDSPLQVGNQSVEVRLSVGVAVYPSNGGSPVDMLRAADTTLYEVKKRGRDGYAMAFVEP